MDEELVHNGVMNEKFVMNFVLNAKIDVQVVMDLSIFFNLVDGTVYNTLIKTCWRN